MWCCGRAANRDGRGARRGVQAARRTRHTDHTARTPEGGPSGGPPRAGCGAALASSSRTTRARRGTGPPPRGRWHWPHGAWRPGHARSGPRAGAASCGRGRMGAGCGRRRAARCGRWAASPGGVWGPRGRWGSVAAGGPEPIGARRAHGIRRAVVASVPGRRRSRSFRRARAVEGEARGSASRGRATARHFVPHLCGPVLVGSWGEDWMAQSAAVYPGRGRASSVTSASAITMTPRLRRCDALRKSPRPAVRIRPQYTVSAGGKRPAGWRQRASRTRAGRAAVVPRGSVRVSRRPGWRRPRRPRRWPPPPAPVAG